MIFGLDSGIHMKTGKLCTEAPLMGSFFKLWYYSSPMGSLFKLRQYGSPYGELF